MQEFYNKMGVIIGFLILMFILQTMAGDKTASKFVGLIIFTMLILNADKLKNFLGDKFTVKEEKED